MAVDQLAAFKRLTSSLQDSEPTALVADTRASGGAARQAAANQPLFIGGQTSVLAALAVWAGPAGRVRHSRKDG